MGKKSGKQVKDLTINPNNPRVATESDLEQLGVSMEELGDISGIVFNVRSGNLVAGNQRSRELDETSEVVITERLKKPNRQGTVAYGHITHKGEQFAYREVSWDENRELAGMMASNNHAGTWNRKILVPQLQKLSSFDLDFDIRLTGFKEQELSKYQKDESAPGTEGPDGDDKTPEGNGSKLVHECPRCGFEFR